MAPSLTTKLQNGSVYADMKHIRNFIEKGTLPDIHEDMGVALAMVPEEQRAAAIDFGACHGMLSIRARTLGWKKVFGLEADKASVEHHNQYVRTAGVTLINTKLDVTSAAFAATIKDMCKNEGINTFISRRVLCELLGTTFGYTRDHWDEVVAAGGKMANAAHDAGIYWWVTEGRARTGNPTHPVDNVLREIEAITSTGKFEVVERHKECAVLKRV